MQIQIKVKKQLVVRKDMDVDADKSKEQLVVRKDMDVDTDKSKGTACSKKGYGCRYRLNLLYFML